MFTGGQFRVLLQGMDTWQLATKMLAIYRDAAKDATGTAECRQVVRMQAVVKAMLEEVVEEVEGAETESV